MDGYRHDLYDMLTGAGYIVNFVGSKKSGLDLEFDRDHEGHPGKEAGYIGDHVKEFLQENHPDIILLHIGTNGIWYKSAETIAAEIDQTLTEIYGFDSHILVVLARIINRTDEQWKQDKTTRLNELIQQRANVRIKNGDPLLVVDMENALTYTAVDGNGEEILVDMYDRAHPNDSGYEKIAIVWNTLLQEYLQGYCAVDHAPKITSSPPGNAYVNLPYTYLVEVSGNPVPTLSLANSPAGMTIDPGSGLITWMPLAAGEVAVSIIAANGVTPTAEQNFILQVNEASTCPGETIAYYHLDESEAPFADAQGGPPAVCSSCPAPTNGRVKKAQRFNGTENGLNILKDEALFDWGSKDSFSIEFWIQRPGSCAGSTFEYNEVVAGRSDSSGNLAWWVGLSCQDGGRARFALRDSDSDNSDDAHILSQTVLTGGSWHHVAAIRDAQTLDIRLYIDGLLEGIAPAVFSSGFESPFAALNIGWLDRSNGFNFEGTIDEIAFFDRALTDREIQQHDAASLQGNSYCLTPNSLAGKQANP